MGLEGEDARALRVEAERSSGRRGLEHLEDLRGGRLPERHDRPNAARTSPIQATSASVVSADDRHEPEQRLPGLLQREADD